ncbi:PREDICTED: uncharacterized protein LOC102876510 [Elephantulus edwardii]|uniref:uncharacterized protein LOC102876510 n=1 Tax=Elephantulus edwardii TaxID=28737 RepID=UPI0003F0631E|nr:PREDICTED: uncharacterized protein LOC102876510 [Elephantulus edwardii]
MQSWDSPSYLRNMHELTGKALFMSRDLCPYLPPHQVYVFLDSLAPTQRVSEAHERVEEAMMRESNDLDSGNKWMLGDRKEMQEPVICEKREDEQYKNQVQSGLSGLLPLLVAGVKASGLLRGAGALAAQALRARGANGVSAVPSMVSGGDVPAGHDQTTGWEREVMTAARKGQDPCNMLAPKAAAGTKEDPDLVSSITNKRIVGCICEEDNSAVIWFWLHKGDAQRCSNCGTHYELVTPPVSSLSEPLSPSSH